VGGASSNVPGAVVTADLEVLRGTKTGQGLRTVVFRGSFLSCGGLIRSPSEANWGGGGGRLLILTYYRHVL
jgi:hypothetical protein